MIFGCIALNASAGRCFSRVPEVDRAHSITALRIGRTGNCTACFMKN